MHPPYPPFARGGKSVASGLFFPPCEGGVGGVRAAAHAMHLKTALSRAATYIPSLRRMAEHLPFAMWLTAVSRPEVLVELGTFRRTSNCGFCQAIAALGLSTHAFAVDSWEGDLHDGATGLGYRAWKAAPKLPSK